MSKIAYSNRNGEGYEDTFYKRFSGFIGGVHGVQ
jgi:hypothetical protein